MARPENSNIFGDYKKLAFDSYRTNEGAVVPDDSMLIKLRILDSQTPRDINNKRNYNKEVLTNGKLDEAKVDKILLSEIKKNMILN